MPVPLTHESRNARQRIQVCLEILRVRLEDRPADRGGPRWTDRRGREHATRDGNRDYAASQSWVIMGPQFSEGVLKKDARNGPNTVTRSSKFCTSCRNSLSSAIGLRYTCIVRAKAARRFARRRRFRIPTKFFTFTRKSH